MIELFDHRVALFCFKYLYVLYSHSELYEKGKEAFVSYTQSYTKHECSHILRVKELDFGKLAEGFGLLHLPKMPEIKSNVQFENFAIDYAKIPYKYDMNFVQTVSKLILSCNSNWKKCPSKRDKHKEKERLKRIEIQSTANKKPKFKSKKTISWSNNKEKQLKRKIKRDKKDINEKRKRDEIEDNDYDELEKDFKLLKKLKKRKVSYFLGSGLKHFILIMCCSFFLRLQKPNLTRFSCLMTSHLFHK